jgi:hypothetical protein
VEPVREVEAERDGDYGNERQVHLWLLRRS